MSMDKRYVCKQQLFLSIQRGNYDIKKTYSISSIQHQNLEIVYNLKVITLNIVLSVTYHLELYSFTI